MHIISLHVLSLYIYIFYIYTQYLESYPSILLLKSHLKFLSLAIYERLEVLI